MRTKILFTIVFIFSVISCYSSPLQLNTPSVKSINEMKVSQNGIIALSCTDSNDQAGIYFSKDEGKNWNKIASENNGVFDLNDNFILFNKLKTHLNDTSGALIIDSSWFCKYDFVNDEIGIEYDNTYIVTNCINYCLKNIVIKNDTSFYTLSEFNDQYFQDGIEDLIQNFENGVDYTDISTFISDSPTIINIQKFGNYLDDYLIVYPKKGTIFYAKDDLNEIYDISLPQGFDSSYVMNLDNFREVMYVYKKFDIDTLLDTQYQVFKSYDFGKHWIENSTISNKTFEFNINANGDILIGFIKNENGAWNTKYQITDSLGAIIDEDALLKDSYKAVSNKDFYLYSTKNIFKIVSPNSVVETKNDNPFIIKANNLIIDNGALADINIYDYLGRKVYSANQINQLSINDIGLDKGFYLLQIIISNQFYLTKIYQ